MSEQLPPSVVTWPFWGQPFAKTARGLHCRRHTIDRTILVVVVTLAQSLPFLFVKPGFIGLGLFAGVVFLVTAVHHIIFVKPILPVVREARDALVPWRKQWVQFERESLAFQQQVRHAGHRLEDAWAMAPALPDYSYHLRRTLNLAMPEYGIPFGRPEERERAAYLVTQGLTSVLCNLVRLGGPMVVGRSGEVGKVGDSTETDHSKSAAEAGVGCLVALLGTWSLTGDHSAAARVCGQNDPEGVTAIIRVADGYQQWVKLNYVQHGDALVPHLLTGTEEWSNRYQDAFGNRYRGDLATVRRWLRFGFGGTLVFGCLPLLGLFLVLGAVVTAFRSLFLLDRVAFVRAQVMPSCGDSADAAIIGVFRDEAPGIGWSSPSKAVEATLEATQRRVLEAVTSALPRVS